MISWFEVAETADIQ